MQTVIFVLALVAAALAAPQQYSEQHIEKKPIAILKLASDVLPDGSFNYIYETENGIKAEARGILNNAGSENEALAVQGSYSFVAPDDGVTYTVTYTADENGFLAQGAHLPVPPPIPEEILKALEYNRSHPEEDGEEAKRN